MTFKSFNGSVPGLGALAAQVDALLAGDASIDKVRGAIYRHLAAHFEGPAGVGEHLEALRLSVAMTEVVIAALPVDETNAGRILAYAKRYTSQAAYNRLINEYPLDAATKAKLKERGARIFPPDIVKKWR